LTGGQPEWAGWLVVGQCEAVGRVVGWSGGRLLDPTRCRGQPGDHPWRGGRRSVVWLL